MELIFARYRQYFAVLLFILTGLLVTNAAINRHVHIYKGYVVSHAHPYSRDDVNQSPVKSHHHTDAEFIVLNLITNLQVLAGCFIFLTAIVILIRLVEIIPAKVFIQLLPYTSQKYRAPPRFS
ncbi:MAG: hypothetical protein JW723_05270 [Bacteroidales bacterium]|nr:hypothetical protein [Bacteroidales bacterium]